MRLEFLSKPSTFTPLFEADPPAQFLSVNAGDPRLYIGGAGINYAFESSLLKCGHIVKAYTELHKRALKTPGVLIRDPNADVHFCLGLTGPRFDNPQVCAVILDVFHPSRCPEKNPRNGGMLYVIGPKGSQTRSKEEFLELVEATGWNMVKVMGEFEKLCPDEAKFEVMRLCLVSGGVFRRRGVQKCEVAAALLRGLRDMPDHITIQCAWDDNAFGEAKKIISENK